MIKVLIEGLHQDHKGDDAFEYVIDPLTSSVTLIRDGGKNILVDSGAFFHSGKLLEALEAEGLKADDIDHVLNTHYHLDHTTNNFLFKNAFVGVGQNLLDHKTGKAHIYHTDDNNVNDPKRNPHFPKMIEDLPTPGHTVPHHSYIYKEDGVTYVLAGDAISEKRLRKGKVRGYDVKAFLQNMIKILEIADTIIPGHGPVIEGENLRELLKLANSIKL
jgi:glyoxylase-like metal-dependent hydrolase (beta-lactamase superfamily II)